MLMNASGHLQVTVVDGTTLTGIFAADGSLNVYDATNETGFVGLQHPCGAINCVSSSGTTLTGAQAPNGAYYVVNDSAEIGLRHSSGGLCVTNFTVSEAVSFLSTWGPYGMVMDFTDASIAIKEASGVLDFTSQGQVSGGALVGPGAKTTYSAPSVKNTEQADGFIKFQAHNLVSNSVQFGGTGYTSSNVTPTQGATDPRGGTSATQLVISPSGYAQITTVAVIGASYSQTLAMRTVSGTAQVRLYANGATLKVTTCNLTTEWTYFQNDYVANSVTEGVGVADNTLATGSTIIVAFHHVRRTPSVDTYIATTSAAAYDLPYVYSGGELQSIVPEPAATNLVLRSNDFTNASWTKSNMTTALTATGPDGVANSASTLTATAANATAMQAITSASASRLTSVYIKRRTGSGNIDLTQDNGTTWTTQTVTSSWTRVALSAVTSTNPTVGIRIVTSGDAVDVWCFQHETGTVATSPIITYGAAVARAADTPQALLNLFPSIGTAYTIYAKYMPQSASVATTAIRLDDTTANELVSLGNNASGAGLATVTDGGVSQASITSGTITASAFHRVAASVEANNVLLVVNGGAGVQDTSVTLPTLTRLLLTAGGGQELQQLAILPGARTEAQLQALGA